MYWNTFVYKMQSEQAQAYSQYYPYKLILEEHGVLEVKLWPPQASCIETERGISGACGEFTKCLKQLSCRLYINCASVPRRIDARCFEKKWSQQKRSHLILIIVIKKKKCVFFESIHDNSHLPKTFTRYCMLYSMYEVSALDAQRSRYQLTTETCVLGQDA